MQLKKFKDLHVSIFKWWRSDGRILPWREKLATSSQTSDFSNQNILRETTFNSYFSPDSLRDPYRVVVSEIMLQQTQVDRVKQKYEAWMKKWPKIEDLAAASLAEVIIEWKGLGYNRRARFLWLLAQEITQRSGQLTCLAGRKAPVTEKFQIDSCSRGQLTARLASIDGWPTTEKELLKLPGIGRYTARAIMSFALGKQVGVVDTNIRRIFSRTFLEEGDLFLFADQLLPTGLADPWNQALMDFGALICTAKNPKCELCPISDLCAVNAEAIKEGYKNYSEKLATGRNAINRVPTIIKSKDIRDGKKIPFEQTDRYLRGRIIDVLREQSLDELKLINQIQSNFPQFEKERIVKQISQLEKENMIKKHFSAYTLG